MFSAVLVANRGEIAVRICKTLRRMGIRSAVVASIPDRNSLAARTADTFVLLEGYTAAETYLDEGAIIAAAKSTGCDAIHPGYGFLSERAGFAERCLAEGITFIGPPPSVLRSLGDKSSARRMAVAAGVPVVPGWDGADDEATLTREATRIGFPVMLKARGGGGGRGMREVHEPAALAEAIDSARREAQAAFGDAGLLIEKLVTGAHHVEVQILADAHGNLVHLGERDCSVQRRRQKLIEESPSPVVDDVLRERLAGAALRIAHAAGYVNAGTVEFLVHPAPSGLGRDAEFYFLEVNPRLQVEHPVTEMVTGLDLVELQLRVAAGEALPFGQTDIRFAGHAIEFRISAEDPWDGFKPSTGRITSGSVPVRLGRFGVVESATRVDSGMEEGDDIPPHYDSLIEKVIVHDPSRDEAIQEAQHALRRRLDGIVTNVDLHRAILSSPGFANGRATIGWLERELASLLDESRHDPELWVAAALGLHHLRREGPPGSPSTPFSAVAGWIGAGPSTVWLRSEHELRPVSVQALDERSATVRVGEESLACRWTAPGLRGLAVGPNGRRLEPQIHHHNVDSIEVNDGDQAVTFRIALPPPLPPRARAAEAGTSVVTAPLTGRVAAIRVRERDTVAAGDVLAILDAMKMEHRILATIAGTVRRIAVAEGDNVREGDLLFELE